MPGSNDPTLDMYNNMCMKEVMDKLNKEPAADPAAPALQCNGEGCTLVHNGLGEHVPAAEYIEPATPPAPAVPPDAEDRYYQRRYKATYEGQLLSEIATLRAQLAAKTEECKSIYASDKQTQEIIGKYMKDAEDAKAQLAEAERKYAELKDGYRLRVEDIDDLLEKVEQAERKGLLKAADTIDGYYYKGYSCFELARVIRALAEASREKE